MADDELKSLRVSTDSIQGSRGVEALSGRPPEDFYADPRLLIDVMHPDDRARWQALVEDPGRFGGEPVPLRYLGPDGSVGSWRQRE